MTQYETAETDNEFQQVKIKDLIDEYKVTMFTTNACDGKAFAAEQKKKITQKENIKSKNLI